MDSVQGTHQLNQLLRDDSLLDTQYGPMSGSISDANQAFDSHNEEDDSISVATSKYSTDTFDNMYEQSDNEDNNNNNNTNYRNNYHSNYNNSFRKKIAGPNVNKFKRQNTANTSDRSGKLILPKGALKNRNSSTSTSTNNTSTTGSSRVGARGRDDSLATIRTDDSFATTVYTEETVELRDGEKMRQLKKKSKKGHRSMLSFRKDSLNLSNNNSNNNNNINPLTILEARQLNPQNKLQPIDSNNSNNLNNLDNSNNVPPAMGGLSKQLNKYYGNGTGLSSDQHKIRESIDLDSQHDLMRLQGSRSPNKSVESDNTQINRGSLVAKKSVLTLRQRTDFPTKQIRVKLYLPHHPEDETPQTIILFINPGATMGFVKSFLEDSYPHKYLRGRIKHLCIADEDGDIDDDFPPIDSKQDISTLGIINFYVDVEFTNQRNNNPNPAMNKVDSLIEMEMSMENETMARNSIDNAPSLPDTFMSDNNIINDNNNNNNDNYYQNLYTNPNTNVNNNNHNNHNNDHGIYDPEKRLSDASRQLNEIRKSAEFERKQKNYFEPNTTSICCSWFCCCENGNNDKNGKNQNSNLNKQYSYRDDNPNIGQYKDAAKQEKQHLLGTYQSPVLPSVGSNTNNNNENNNGYGGLVTNEMSPIGGDDDGVGGTRHTYNLSTNNLISERASVTSQQTHASNRQFSRV